VDEDPAHALAEFVVAPFERQPGADDGAHAGGADEVDRYPRLAERADDPEMGEAPRPGAGENQADGAAGEEARDAPEVVGAAAPDMTQQVDRVAVEPGRGGALGGAVALVQQDEVEALARAGLLLEGGQRRGRAVGLGDDEDA